MSGLSAGRPSSRTGRPVTNLSDLTEQEKPARVNFQLDVTTYRQFKALAARRGVTIKQLLTEYVQQLIAEDNRSTGK